MKGSNIFSLKNLALFFLLFFGESHRLALGNQLKPKVATLINSATVLIQAEGLDPGSGVILRKDREKYYVLTAAHVLGG